MPRILVIDDEESIREMLRAMLEREGYDVLDASNGAEGIKLCVNDPADLIITDIIMPEKDGMETIVEIRREFPDTKIIAISGGDRVEPGAYLEMAKKLGAQDTFTKPFEREAMLAAVRNLVGE